jgi:hypothetical protein
MIVTNPTDAVLDKQTVPAGNRTAAEFWIPRSLMRSDVLVAV